MARRARVTSSAPSPFRAIRAGYGLVIGLPVTWRYRMVGKKSLSLTPSLHWPEPVVVIDTNTDEGPAITSIEYKIDPKTAEEFRKR